MTEITFSVIGMGIPWRLALPCDLTIVAGGPMEAVELPLARKSLKSPGVRGTLSPFGVPRSSYLVISNRQHVAILPSSWYTLAVLGLSPLPPTGSVVTRLLGRPMYLPGWGLTRAGLGPGEFLIMVEEESPKGF